MYDTPNIAQKANPTLLLPRTHEPSPDLLTTDKLHAAIIMYEASNHNFKHSQSKTLPLLSPPPYAPAGPLTTPSLHPPPPSSPLSPHDDYRCTISHALPDTTIVHISIHIHTHLATDRIPCWRVRRKLIALDQPICVHRCTSDPAFFRAVRRRRMNTLCISFGSREYLPFFGRWSQKSRVWRCKESACNMAAWVDEDRDTGDLRLHARTFWAGVLGEADAGLLEQVKVRAQEGGGLVYE